MRRRSCSPEVRIDLSLQTRFHGLHLGRQWEQESFQSRHTWIFNITSGNFHELSKLNVARVDHSCARVSRGGRDGVLVAGGKKLGSSASDISLLEWYDIRVGDNSKIETSFSYSFNSERRLGIVESERDWNS